MRELIKTDLKRILKDKLLIITCIIGVVLALTSPLLYKALFGMMDADEALMGLVIDSKTLFFTAFAPGNNFGLIAPILIAIILCKDFSYGTVRNKIISGKSRTSIFFSLFISGTIIMCAVILIHAVITLLTSLLFFEYQATPFEAKDFGYLMISVLLEIAVYVFISALISFFCVSMKNAGLAVVMYFAVNFLFSIIGSIVAVAAMFVTPEQELLGDILEFLGKSNIFISTAIGTGTSYELKDILYVLVPALGGSALLGFFGTMVFRKKDIK